MLTQSKLCINMFTTIELIFVLEMYTNNTRKKKKEKEAARSNINCCKSLLSVLRCLPQLSVLITADHNLPNLLIFTGRQQLMIIFIIDSSVIYSSDSVDNISKYVSEVTGAQS